MSLFNILCPFCKQLLFQAFLHVQHQFAVCSTCFVEFVVKFGMNQFRRVSLLIEQGKANRLMKVKRINNDFKQFISVKTYSIEQSVDHNIIEQFFHELNTSFKSSISDISTSITIQQSQSKQSDQSQVSNIISLQQESKFNQLKSKISQNACNLVEKLKQNERIQKNLQNIDQYKNRIIETSGHIKDKFNSFRSQIKNIKSQLPDLKNTINSLEIKTFFKSTFLKWGR